MADHRTDNDRNGGETVVLPSGHKVPIDAVRDPNFDPKKKRDKVMIDKLPFAPPDDPVLSARIEKINAEGRNAFMEYQLPRAVISLKQGAGRLIRDEADRGVLMICDPRLISKAYGKRIWRSLPPMTRTREVADVAAFFAQEPAAS